MQLIADGALDTVSGGNLYVKSITNGEVPQSRAGWNISR